MFRVKKFLKSIIITAIWLGVWQILSAVVGLSVLLPSPHETLLALCELCARGDFWHSVLMSVVRITIGFLIGSVAGLLAAAGSAFSGNFNSLLSPLMHIIKATPVASFIILAVVWLKTGNVPSFTAALMVFPIVWSNVKTGIKETDRGLIEMSDAFGVKAADKLRYIYLPSMKPYFISAMTTAMGLAWKAGIAAEVICNPKTSIGSGIYESKIYLETPKLFAWTATVIIISIALERLMLVILERGKAHD